MTGEPNATRDRSQPPHPGPVRPFDFPPVTSSDLPNGLGLRIARMGRFPLVTVAVVLDAGESLLPDAEAGLAVLAGQALEGGSRSLSGLRMAEALEGLGTALSVQTGWDSTVVSLTCVAERMEEAVRLLADALLDPAFPPDEVERLRDQRLAAIRQRRMDPGNLADDTASHFFYLPEVPYHRPLAGTPESVQGMGPERIRSFTESYYRPEGAGLVVVGDVEAREVEDLAREYFQDWAGAPGSGPDFEAAPRFRERKILVVDRPGSVQSEIRIGHPGVARSTPHYFPLQVFNTVLGGAFTSRLMLNLRERQGFTYGVRSRFTFRRSAGPFKITTAVGTEVTAPAVKAALAELEGLLREGPSLEEVERARDFIAGIFPLQLETTGQVAARIGELLVYDLPDDFFSTYRDRIRAVTPEATSEAGRSVVRPSEAVVLIVGDEARIRGPLEDLGLGSVEVVAPT